MFPNAGPPKQIPLRMPVSAPGSDFANPKADAINKKRKKYQMKPSMAGLHAAASNAPKPFLSEGQPGAGVGGNL
jgi:hypothetical protein